VERYTAAGTDCRRREKYNANRVKYEVAAYWKTGSKIVGFHFMKASLEFYLSAK
jgi:hypothetical protein